MTASFQILSSSSITYHIILRYIFLVYEKKLCKINCKNLRDEPLNGAQWYDDIASNTGAVWRSLAQYFAARVAWRSVSAVRFSETSEIN
jgi:hypothetical protein